MRKITARGQSVEEAIQSALKQLTLDRDQVEIEVIDEGKKGFLGIFGSSNAVVEVREKGLHSETVETKDVEEANSNHEVKQVTEEQTMDDDQSVEEVKKYLETIAKGLDVSDIEVNVIENEKLVTFDLVGSKIAILIGKRGRTLNALQYLAQLALNKNGGVYRSVVVDAEGYRDRRKETLIELANRMADKAVNKDRKVILDSMPAYERKIIHSVLQERGDVSTYSEGVEPHRHIVIKP